MPKSANTAYIRNYFITLPLYLSLASLAAAADFTLLHGSHQMFDVMHSLEKLNGRLQKYFRLLESMLETRSDIKVITQ